MFSPQHEVLDNFLTLTKISSETGKEQEIIEYLIKRLKQYTRNFFEQGRGNIIAKIKGNARYKPLLLCAHLDTVSPGVNISPQIENNIIRSNGKTILGADDKAGIAAILTLLKIIAKNEFDICPLEIVFTVSEEQGLLGAKNLDYKQLTAKYGFIIDTSGEIGTACIKAPSYLFVKAIVNGKSAHAGMDAKSGINAIKIAAEALANIPTGAIDNETTMNIGKIQGGIATNIVPAITKTEFEIRSYSDAKIKKYFNIIDTAFKNAIKKNKGSSFEITSELQFKTFEITDKSKILQLFKTATKRINIPCKLEKTFGGSDANIFNQHGIETLNISAGYNKPHTLEENISLEALNKSVELLLSIVKTASNAETGL